MAVDGSWPAISGVVSRLASLAPQPPNRCARSSTPNGSVSTTKVALCSYLARAKCDLADAGWFRGSLRSHLNHRTAALAPLHERAGPDRRGTSLLSWSTAPQSSGRCGCTTSLPSSPSKSPRRSPGCRRCSPRTATRSLVSTSRLGGATRSHAPESSASSSRRRGGSRASRRSEAVRCCTSAPHSTRGGGGLATAAHDELVGRLRARGVVRPVLYVYAENARGRRFWEKHGWQPTGETLRGSFPPYAELHCYELAPGVVTATEDPPVPG